MLCWGFVLGAPSKHSGESATTCRQQGLNASLGEAWLFFSEPCFWVLSDKCLKENAKLYFCMVLAWFDYGLRGS